MTGVEKRTVGGRPLREEDEAMGKYALVIFSNPSAPDREDEYNTWYTNQHLKDVVSIPGYSAAQRFKRQISMIGDLQHNYLAIYDMDAQTPEEAAKAVEALVSTPMDLSDALDSDGVLGGIFEACGATVTAASGKPTGAFRMLAMSDAVEGREADYNNWYDNVHLKEVTSVPGFTSAERFKLHQTIGGEFKNRYIALYGMEADAMETAGAALQGLAGSNLQLSDASRNEDTMLFIYETISPKVVAPKEKTLA
jgi:hypothetical protein